MPVDQWLKALGLERYAAAFEANDVTEDVLPTLTADDLRDIGVISVGHRRRAGQGSDEPRPDRAGTTRRAAAGQRHVL